MSTSLQLNTQFTETFEPTTSPIEDFVETSHTDVTNLHSQVTVLTNSISDEAVRLMVGKVLTDLVFLLDYLSLVATHREHGGIREVVAILDAVRGESYSLAVFIENHALHLEGIDDRLSQTLDSSAYAINHEVRRIFNGDLAKVSVDQDDQETRGVLLHAQGVLTNCFQQCMINLARVFDSSLTDDRLFQDWQSRRESSLILYHDLKELITLLQASEKISGSHFPERSLDFLARRLSTFRDGSMQSLMYKDWQQFEVLSGEIVASIRKRENPTPLLHNMGCYLETLLAHVKTRSVLADLALEPIGAL